MQEMEAAEAKKLMLKELEKVGGGERESGRVGVRRGGRREKRKGEERRGECDEDCQFTLSVGHNELRVAS